MTTSVPFLDLGAQHAEIADEVWAGLQSVFERTAFVGGKEVTSFEEAYARFIGTEHCIGVGNGTDALELAYRAVGVGPGDEVIMPANTFIATAEAASRIGAVPVFVDVDPRYLLMDPAKVEEHVTERTRAIVPVHLFGQMAPLELIQQIADRHGIAVVEDAAQSQGASRHGKMAGSVGLVAGTSFYPGKNLGASGDAGAVTTNDALLAHSVRLLSVHGSEVKYEHKRVGFNSRLDTVHAVQLRAKLDRLEKWNDARRTAAARYQSYMHGTEDVSLPDTMPGNLHVWHLYVIQVNDRDRVVKELSERGIGAGIHYPVPVHLTPAYAPLGQGPGCCPVAEAAANHIVSLPMFPHITPDQQERVCLAMHSILS